MFKRGFLNKPVIDQKFSTEEIVKVTAPKTMTQVIIKNLPDSVVGQEFEAIIEKPQEFLVCLALAAKVQQMKLEEEAKAKLKAERERQTRAVLALCLVAKYQLREIMKRQTERVDKMKMYLEKKQAKRVEENTCRELVVYRSFERQHEPTHKTTIWPALPELTKPAKVFWGSLSTGMSPTFKDQVKRGYYKGYLVEYIDVGRYVHVYRDPTDNDPEPLRPEYCSLDVDIVFYDHIITRRNCAVKHLRSTQDIEDICEQRVNTPWLDYWFLGVKLPWFEHPMELKYLLQGIAENKEILTFPISIRLLRKCLQDVFKQFVPDGRVWYIAQNLYYDEKLGVFVDLAANFISNEDALIRILCYWGSYGGQILANIPGFTYDKAKEVVRNKENELLIPTELLPDLEVSFRMKKGKKNLPFYDPTRVKGTALLPCLKERTRLDWQHSDRYTNEDYNTILFSERTLRWLSVRALNQ